MDLTSYAQLAVRLVNTAAGVYTETDQLGTTGAFRAFLDEDPQLRGPWTHHDLDALRMLRAEHPRTDGQQGGVLVAGPVRIPCPPRPVGETVPDG